MGQPESTPDSRRMLLTVAVSDYPDGGVRFRSGMDAQAAAVRDWWCDPRLGGGGFTHHAPDRLATRVDIDEFIRHLDLRGLKPDDVVVLLVSGHGLSGEARQHYLLLPDTDPQRLLATAYPTAQLVTALLASHAEHVLVVVSSCFAGALHEELARLRKDLPKERQRLPTLGVFTCADHDERPHVRELVELLARVHHQLTTTTQIDREHLSFVQLGTELHQAARRDPPLLPPIRLLPVGDPDQPSRCLPNPGYQPRHDLVAPARRQVAVTEADLAYWWGKASGQVTTADTGWYFSGRRPIMTTLVDFLRDQDRPGLLVVTGAAGSGKSAVIARAVTLSDPTFRRDPRFTSAVADVPPELTPPLAAIDAAVLARNKDTDELAAQLLTALGASGTDPNSSATSGTGAGRTACSTGANDTGSVTDLVGRIRELATDRRLTLVVDGVDEAWQPARLVTELLGPLARAGIRLLLGVRSQTTGPDPGPEPAADLVNLGRLLRQVAGHTPVTTVRTDGPDARDGIEAYVTALLGPDYPRRPEIASLIAEHTTPSFLDARLAAQQLRETTTAKDPTDPHWQATLQEGTVALLRQDLHDLAGPDHPLKHLLAVLRAPAFALGAGLPWSDIWPTVAQAILGVFTR